MFYRIVYALRIPLSVRGWRPTGIALGLLCAGLCAAWAVTPRRHSPHKAAPKAARKAIQWQQADIGTPPNGRSGSATVANGRFTIRGVGADDIWTHPGAQIHFQYAPVEGDFEFVVHLIGKDEEDRETSRVGIMMRQSLAQDSPYLFCFYANHHLQGTERNTQGTQRPSFNSMPNVHTPVWLKMVRWHGTLSAYYSDDGKLWTTISRSLIYPMPDSGLIGVAVSHGMPTGATTASFEQVYLGPPRLPYRTSWVGNTFGGGEKHIEDHIAAMYVAPDGTCYTQAEWDEGGANASIYRNGDMIGWLLEAGRGSAITGDGQFLYIGQQVAKTPPSVRRLKLDGALAPFPDRGNSSDIPIPAGSTITALAVGKDALFVADGPHNGIRVYDPVAGTPRAEWACQDPHTLAVDREGNLWVNQRVDGHAVIACFTPEGQPTGRKIQGLVDPGALAFDGQGRLLVAENGPDQQVRIYSGLNATPTLVRTFGTKGGVYSGVPGEVGEHKLPANIVGLGTDNDGNLYIGSDGWGWSGVDVRKYSPAGKMQWRLLGLEGVIDFGDLDPVTQTDLYSEQEHFTLDWSKPQGQEWTYKGYTLDKFAFPDDPRLHINGQSSLVRYLKDDQGHPRRFLFQTNEWGSFLATYRFDAAHGEIAIPCMLRSDGLAKGAGDVPWPDFQPRTGDWQWRDSRGDGRVRAEEISTLPTEGKGWDVDANGDIWQGGRSLYHFKYMGLDEHGVPRYAEPEKIALPAPLIEARRLYYSPSTDTLTVSGYTQEHPNKPYNGFNFAGTELMRFDHWSRGASPPVWRSLLPRDEKTGGGLAYSLDVTEDYAFAVCLYRPDVTIYEMKTGKECGTLAPGPEVAGESGWVDMPYAIHASRLRTGEYVVLVEEDGKNKILMYRWTPPGTQAASAKPRRKPGPLRTWTLNGA